MNLFKDSFGFLEWLKPDFKGKKTIRKPLEPCPVHLQQSCQHGTLLVDFRLFAAKVLKNLPDKHSITELLVDLSDYHPASCECHSAGLRALP